MTAVPAGRLPCGLRGRRGGRNHHNGTAGFALVAGASGSTLVTGCALRAGVSLIAGIALAAGITACALWARRAGNHGAHNHGLRRGTVTGAQTERHHQDCEWN